MKIFHYMPKGPNVGDSIIDLATKKFFRSIFPDAEFFSFRSHTHAGFYGETINLHEYDRMAGIRRESLKLFGTPDLIVIGGAPSWASDTLVALETESIRARGTPIVFFGSGTKYYKDPSRRSTFMAQLSEISQQVIAAGARDEPTYRDMKLQGLPAYMTGCPVMYYVGEDIKWKKSEYFIIPFRSDKIPAHLQIDMEFIKELENVLEAKHLVVFQDYSEVCHAEALSGGLFKRHPLNFLVEYNPDNLLPFYKNAKFVFSYRLHGTLTGATCGTPFLQLNMDGRGNDFSKTFDPEGKYTISHAEATKERMLAKVRNMIAHKDYYSYTDFSERVRDAHTALEQYKNKIQGVMRGEK